MCQDIKIRFRGYLNFHFETQIIKSTTSMSKYLYIITIISFGLFHSCKEHIKPEIQKAPPKQTKPTQQLDLKPLDHDPYFEGTTDISSEFGPKTITRNILQDKNGNIWLATWDGIVRYDGQSDNAAQDSFINLTNKNKLRRYRAFTILEDSKGNIWFGTIGAGVYRYDGNSFANFTKLDGLVDDRVTCIYEDSKGIIWFGTTGGVSCYDGKSFKNFTTADGLTDNDVNSIVEDSSGKFWFGTRGTACTYDGSIFTKITNKAGNAYLNVRTIIEDRNGNIWLGGNDGLWRYNNPPLPVTPKFTQVSTEFTGYIFEDSKGNIWTTSENGGPRDWVISRYDESAISSWRLKSTKILEEENMFFGIAEDKKGGFWFGSLKGVYRYDGNSIEYFE